MIAFGGRLEERPDPVGWEHRRDPASASRGELLWHFFPGDIFIRVDDNCWETNLGWVPLLHFALSLTDVYARIGIAEDAEAEYNFTESDDEIGFRRSGDIVTISPRSDDFKESCTLLEFRLAAGRFIKDILGDIGTRFPSILETPLAVEIFERSEFLAK